MNRYSIKDAYLNLIINEEAIAKKYIVVLQNNKYNVQTVDDAIIFTDINKAKEMADAKNKEFTIKQQNIQPTQKVVQDQQVR